jgi:hypothetical protein
MVWFITIYSNISCKNYVINKPIESANEYKISGITYRLTQGQYPRDKPIESANEYKVSGICMLFQIFCIH